MASANRSCRCVCGGLRRGAARPNVRDNLAPKEWRAGLTCSGLVNCGMKATTKSPGLGLRTFESRPVAKTRVSDCLCVGTNEIRLRHVIAL
jgi:hypothetical protein